MKLPTIAVAASFAASALDDSPALSLLAGLRAIRERARALGYGELLHLRTGDAGGRVWVAYQRSEPSHGATLAAACAAWIAAHPAPEVAA